MHDFNGIETWAPTRNWTMVQMVAALPTASFHSSNPIFATDHFPPPTATSADQLVTTLVKNISLANPLQETAFFITHYEPKLCVVKSPIWFAETTSTSNVHRKSYLVLGVSMLCFLQISRLPCVRCSGSQCRSASKAAAAPPTRLHNAPTNCLLFIVLGVILKSECVCTHLATFQNNVHPKKIMGE